MAQFPACLAFELPNNFENIVFDPSIVAALGGFSKDRMRPFSVSGALVTSGSKQPLYVHFITKGALSASKRKAAPSGAAFQIGLSRLSLGGL